MRPAVSIPTSRNSEAIAPAAGLGPRPDGRPASPLQPAEATEQEVAAYLFDLLVGARRLASIRKHRFLAYLIGMAVEEARLLMLGRSAARATGPASPSEQA